MQPLRFSKHLIHWCSAILLSVYTTISYANSEIGTLDTIHYIPPLYAKSGINTPGNIRDHYLLLSTLETTPFTVTMTNASGSINETITLSRSEPVKLELSAAPFGARGLDALNIISADGANLVNTEDGLVLSGEQRFYANLRHRSHSQGGSLVAKGQTALGKRFRSGHLHTNSALPWVKSHFISVMATIDNTTVTFSDIAPGLTFVGGQPSTVLLNQHESFVIAVELDQADNRRVANELNGTLITSDNPIVINSGSFLAGHGTPVSRGRDMGIDQIVPIDYLGTEYIAALGNGGINQDNLETPIVVADTDNTAIYINDNTDPEAIINAGEYHIISGDRYISDAMYIKTSQPAYIYQSTSSNNINGQGMNFLAPLVDNLAPQDLFLPEVDLIGEATISIIAPQTATISINDTPITGGASIPGLNDHLFYSITGETGDVYVSGTESFALMLINLSVHIGAATYYSGFPNSFAIDDETTTQADTPVVIDVLANDVSGNHEFSVESVLASLPEYGTAVINADGTITYTPNGIITEDQFSYQINNGLSLTDTATVTVRIDTDGDGIPDINDSDNDNDGIPDIIEIGDTPNTPLDTDHDGIPNYLDTDSDNDGISDETEAQVTGIDSDNDGIDDLFDVDQTMGQDDNNDGIDDNVLLPNSDNDSIIDLLDLDSDNDGINDVIEAGLPDADGNGLKDSDSITNTPPDQDGDNIPDYRDVDSNNDGTHDLINTLPDTLDLNNDGIIDDATDRDQDGISDIIDNQPEEFGTSPATLPETEEPEEDSDTSTNRSLDNSDDTSGTSSDVSNSSGGLETAARGSGSISLMGILLMLFTLGLRTQQLQRWLQAASKRCSIALLSLMAMFASSTSIASSEYCGLTLSGDEFNDCWYLGAGIGLSHLDPEGSYNGWATDDESSSGYMVQLGYLLTPHWFWEITYIDAGEAGLGNIDPAVEATIPDAAITYKIPSTGLGYYLLDKPYGWNLYAKAGLSWINTDTSDSRIVRNEDSSYQLAVSLGGEYRFNNSPWFAQLQLDSFDRDAEFLSLRISRYFGGQTPADPQPEPEPEPILIPVILDLDNDGVPDEADKCPKSPIGQPVNVEGCSVFNGVMKGINFELNKTTLTPTARNRLHSTVDTLQTYPDTQIEIHAHTDNQGSEAYNQTLSERRANSVADYLIENGIEADRLKQIGYGETRPIESNATPEGRALNRRVEMHVIDQ